MVDPDGVIVVAIFESACESGLLFLREIVFFELVNFPCFQPNPYTRMCVLTVGSFNCFGKQMQYHEKTIVECCFGGFSLTTVSLYI